MFFFPYSYTVYNDSNVEYYGSAIDVERKYNENLQRAGTILSVQTAIYVYVLTHLCVRACVRACTSCLYVRIFTFSIHHDCRAAFFCFCFISHTPRTHCLVYVIYALSRIRHTRTVLLSYPPRLFSCRCAYAVTILLLTCAYIFVHDIDM